MLALSTSSPGRLSGGGGISLAGVGTAQRCDGARVHRRVWRFQVQLLREVRAGTYQDRFGVSPESCAEDGSFRDGDVRNSREVAEAADRRRSGRVLEDAICFTQSREWMATTDIGGREVAAQLKLDRTAFGRCVLNPEIRRRIQRHDAIAQQLGIRGTPMFYVNGRTVPGAIPFELFQRVIAEAAR
jgi:hypothetical protein